MKGGPRQLALAFPHDPDYRRLAFLEDQSNAAVLKWLGRPADWPGRRLAIWGEAGCGKTHLLAQWSHARGGQIRSGPDLDAWSDLGAEPAAGSGGIAIDDADLAPDHQLLHTLNSAAENGSMALLAARTPPARWQIRLPDLASRLRAITAVEIGRPDDDLLRALLCRLLRERQLVVARTIQDWLLLRLPRTASAIREAAARLDRIALAAGSQVTRQIALDVVQGMASGVLSQDDDVAAGRNPVTLVGQAPLLQRLR